MASLCDNSYVKAFHLAQVGFFDSARALALSSGSQNGSNEATFQQLFTLAVVEGLAGDFVEQGRVLRRCSQTAIHSSSELLLLQTASSIVEIRMVQDLVGSAVRVNRLWAEASSQSHNTGASSSLLLGDATLLEVKRQLCLAFLLLHTTQEPFELVLSQREAVDTLKELSRALLERDADSLHVAATATAIRWSLGHSSSSYKVLAREAQDQTMALRWELMALEKDAEDGVRLDDDQKDPERWQQLTQLCRSSSVASDVYQNRLDLLLFQARFQNGPQARGEVEQGQNELRELRRRFARAGSYLDVWDTYLIEMKSLAPFQNFETSEAVVQRAVDLSETRCGPAMMLAVLSNKADWFYSHGCHSSAERLARRGLQFVHGLTHYRLNFLLALSQVTSGCEQKRIAEECFDLAKRMEETHSSRRQAARNLAMVYGAAEETRARAEEILHEQITAQAEAGCYDGIADLLHVLFLFASKDRSCDQMRSIAQYTKDLSHSRPQLLALEAAGMEASLALQEKRFEDAMLGNLRCLSLLGKPAKARESCVYRLSMASCLALQGQVSKGLDVLEDSYRDFALIGNWEGQARVRLSQITLARPQIIADEGVYTSASALLLEVQQLVDLMRRDYNALPPPEALVKKLALAPLASRLYESGILSAHKHVGSGQQEDCEDDHLLYWVQQSKSRHFLSSASPSTSAPLFASSSATTPLDDGSPLPFHETVTSWATRLWSSMPPGATLVEWYTVQNQLHVVICKTDQEDARRDQGRLAAPVVRRRRFLYNDYDALQRQLSLEFEEDRWSSIEEPPSLSRFAFLLKGVEEISRPDELVILAPLPGMAIAPLHAFIIGNGEEAQPLLARNPVSYTFGLSRDFQVADPLPSNATTTTTSPLLVGYPHGERFLAQSNYRERLEQLAHSCSARILTSRNASPDKVREETKSASLLYFQTHVAKPFTPEDPLSVSMKLAEGRLTARECMELPSPAKVVVLAGCASLHGTANVVAMLGFSAAFALAGADSVFGTLARIHEEDATAIAEQLLPSLLSVADATERSHAEILRRVILQHRRREGRSHPRHWASFVLHRTR
ncbi:hypothetical protein FA10DRAFT_289458 [Acaromyces ingoldii]|uniref:CHAT domain-containing protein n=1 Tax=Acaromyces ingoldii TaxID=215250 RepID=A0A316YCB7_9BASI|nr:hypothetical protein FA10DRAFT_289458 [Acaromyces ingoldii]PWN86879.1 hypothetical protein FA10DRAFT_289458 [Acaromyces ingoldii]